MKYYFLLFGIVLLFFNQILFGKIPFPGDLLVNNYEPYRSYPVGGFDSGASVPSKLQGADVIRHMFPWKNFTIESIKKGEIPFWNPHNFSGNPLMGNFQSAVFYPINVLFLILPFLEAWTIYIFLIPLLSSLFMFLFLKGIKLSNLASVFGAVIFAFSSYMTVWLEWGNIGHTFLWLPLALFFAEKLVKGFDRKYFLYLILTLAVSILAGYIQVYFYMTLTILIYFAVKNFVLREKSLSKILIFSFSLLLPAVFTLFQILPTIDLFSESTRGNYTLTEIQNLLTPFWYLITTVAPNFFGNPASGNHWFYGTYIERVSYIGLVPFIFFLYAILNFKKRMEIKIFGTIAVLSLLLATDLFITKYFFTIPISIISTTVPTRILAIFQFSAVVLASIGLDLFRRRLNIRTLFLSITVVALMLLGGWVFTYLGSANFHIDYLKLETTRRNLYLPALLLFSFLIFYILWAKAKFRLTKLIPYAIVVLTIFDLFYFFNKLTPFSPSAFVYPQTPVMSYIQKNAGINRFWGYGSGYIESNFQTFDGTFSPDGVDPIHIRRYTRLLEAAKSGKITSDLPRPDANIPPGFSKEDLRSNAYRQRLLNLLGVKYVLNKTIFNVPDLETFPESTYKMLYQDGHYQIYENKDALPRIFLAGDYVVETDKQKIVDRLFSPSFDLSKTLVLEENVPNIKFSKDLESRTVIKNYGNNEVSILTSSKSNMLLFLSDTYFDRWKVDVDGREIKLYRADYVFRAVPLTSGNHLVVFKYKSASFENGLKISSIAFIVFLLLLFKFKKYEKN